MIGIANFTEHILRANSRAVKFTLLASNFYSNDRNKFKKYIFNLPDLTDLNFTWNFLKDYK